MNCSADRGLWISLGLINLMTLMTLSLLVVPRPVVAIPPLIEYQNVAVAEPVPASVPATVGLPTRLVVPDLNIDLTVDMGSYDEAVGDWALSYSSAMYADASMPINNSNGITLIYAHALSGLFGELVGIQPGMVADVYTDTGHKFVYQYTSVREVLPTDISVFQADGSPRMVLQTCSGPWDAYRSLYEFDFISEARV